MDNFETVDGYCPTCSSFLYAHEGWHRENGIAMLWCSKHGFVAPRMTDPNGPNMRATRHQSTWPITHAGNEKESWKYMNQTAMCGARGEGVFLVESPKGVRCAECLRRMAKS